MGLPVHIVFLTDGSGSHPGHPRVTPAAVTAIRLQEARSVLATLGVDSAAIHFLSAPDGSLQHLPPERRETLTNRLAALLTQLQPAEIFLPCKADGSSEHEAAFGYVMSAVARSGARATIWEYPVWLWWNPLTLLTRIAQASGRCRAPTEDYLEIKRRALGRYRSQLSPLPPQSEAALPRDLLRLLDVDAEYFFQFADAGENNREPSPPAI
jgi:LmbE family N-acetylglucosaminyl deacetylase